MTVTAEEYRTEAVRLLATRELERRRAREHPAYFLNHVKCLDAKTGERFHFQLLNEDDPWYWQRGILDGWLAHDRNLVLKARQIGITWLAAGLGLWYAVNQPGARILVISINEVEAIKVVNRIWDMWLSLPEHLRAGRKVNKPSRGARPTTEINFIDSEGLMSSILAMPATETAGHGETATLVILDEYSRQEYASGTWKSTFPTIDGGGRVVVISTANGVSNTNTGEGNYFHYLYVNSETLGIFRAFLGWQMHPDRDERWYRERANALPPSERAEQYPSDPEEAFILTGECHFDLEALAYYSQKIKDGEAAPLRRIRFVQEVVDKRPQARISPHSNGEVRVWEEPDTGGRYAIAADVATGRGSDFSAAYVVDLEKCRFVAEYHASIDPDLFAAHLYYLGRWYEDALMCIEMGGGFGDPVLNALRDGRDGRPPYRNLYRHRRDDRLTARVSQAFGMPMTKSVRNAVVNGIEAAIRERALPLLSEGLLEECRTFVRRPKGTSPRAQDGCNDDRVMAAGMAMELWRQKGTRIRFKRERPKQERWRQTIYAWEKSSDRKRG